MKNRASVYETKFGYVNATRPANRGSWEVSMQTKSYRIGGGSEKLRQFSLRTDRNELRRLHSEQRVRFIHGVHNMQVRAGAIGQHLEHARHPIDRIRRRYDDPTCNAGLSWRALRQHRDFSAGDSIGRNV